MPFYLHSAGGDLDSSFPWTIRAVSTSTATEAAAQTAWDAGITALWTNAAFLALIPTTTTLTFTATSTASSAFKQTTITRTTHNTPGTSTGVGLPMQVCEVVTLRTALATRYGRGRWFLPGMTSSAIATTGFFLSTTAQGDIVTAVNALFTAVGTTLTFVILHRKGTLTGPGPLTTDPITTGDVSNQFRIQRRRGDKFVPTRSAITV